MFKGDTAKLNCTAVDDVRVYDKTSWIYTQSQILLTYKIANNLTIHQFQKENFEFPDNTTYSLSIKQVDKSTSGLYECFGTRDDNKIDYFHAFVMTMGNKYNFFILFI